MWKILPDLDNNILKKRFTGCTTCGNPFNRPEIQEKIKNTCMEKYGVKNPGQIQEVKEKIKETCLRKYGVKNPMQNEEIFKKNKSASLSSRKIYIFPSGRSVFVQGYEPRCLDILLQVHSEDDITVDPVEMPIIRYFNPVKNKLCRYYPDIFIKSKRIIVEVKSDYTYKREECVNRAKFNKVIRLGYQFELYVFGKKELILKETRKKSCENK